MICHHFDNYFGATTGPICTKYSWTKHVSKRSHTKLYINLPCVISLIKDSNHEVPGSIPGSTVGIFLEGEDSRGDHGLGRLVYFRFKAPPGTTSPSITTHTSSGQRNCASWASQLQKSVTLVPCPGGRTTKSRKDMWWHLGGGVILRNQQHFTTVIYSGQIQNMFVKSRQYIRYLLIPSIIATITGGIQN